VSSRRRGRTGRAAPRRGRAALSRRLSRTARFLDRAYGLGLELEPAEFLLPAGVARRWLGPHGPRSGVVSRELGGELLVGIYVDPRDADDAGTLVEETSHWLCLVWHARRELPVPPVVLELQAEVDRFLHARCFGGDPLAHFERFRWAPWLATPGAPRERYEDAHRAARRYCRHLLRRFPRPRDLPALLGELRDFYRSSPQEKWRAAA